MASPNLTEANIEKIAQLFPNVITEGKDEDGNLKKVIDFERLKQELSSDVIDGDESYDFTWVGKNEAILEANKPIRKTLRPYKAESKDWDTTENLYIEGDNLEALKLLQESYLNKVKMIYIDPPYNTGKDFVYKDNFTQDKNEYDEESGIFDEEGNRLFLNAETNGRFHSDWCSMIYPRLRLARNLLTDDGVIFISIDDHEVDNLKKICNEIYGEDNFIGNIIVKSNPRGSQSVGELAGLHEYLLVFCKNKEMVNIAGHKLTESMLSEYKLSDKQGQYRLLGLRQRGGFWRRSERPSLFYPIYVNPNTLEISVDAAEDATTVAVYPIQPTTSEEGSWRWSKDKLKKDGQYIIPKLVQRNGSEEWDIFQKDYLTNGDEPKRTKAKSIWDDKDFNYQNGTIEIKKILQSSVFDYSKPTYLIAQMIEMINDKDLIILDFFSGSATTAHSVIQFNAKDSGNRRFIMCQLPEKLNPEDKNQKVACEFLNSINKPLLLTEIGKERIRRAGKKIQEENPDKKIDTGFRVLKIDSTNMNDVYYTPAEYSQNQLNLLENNIKSNRTDEDLLYGILLDWGIELSLSHTVETIEGINVHIVDNGELIACFAENVPEVVIRQIAQRQPLRAVFRDNSFSTSPEKINVEEIFKLLAPNTRVKVI